MPSEEKRRQEIRPLQRIRDDFRKILIVNDMMSSHQSEGASLSSRYMISCSIRSRCSGSSVFECDLPFFGEEPEEVVHAGELLRGEEGELIG